MKTTHYCFVLVAFLIPGKPHRWAKGLLVDRATAKSFYRAVRRAAERQR